MRRKNVDSAGIEIVGLPKNAFSKSPEEIQQYIVPKHQIDPEKQMFVKSNFKSFDDDGAILAFYERDEAHPSGEAFVAGNTPTLVALTSETVKALNEGKILECDFEEVRAFKAGKIAKARKELEKEKQSHRQKFIQVTGSENGFENAWTNLRAEKALAIVEQGI
jgi:hypothetical protein